jgi:benzaldehyde dehydrogenase (NAD)
MNLAKQSDSSVPELAPSHLWSEKVYIGEWGPAGAGTIDVTEKATGKVIGTVGRASAQDVARAASMARDAQPAWAALPGPERGDILRAVSRLIQEHAAQICSQLVRETGAIGPKAHVEVDLAAREVLEAAALATQPPGLLLASATGTRRSIARRIPMGIVGAIVPWNSPFLLALRALGPALVTGNAVLLKPDPQSPICGGVLFAQLFAAAKLPRGLLHVLPGGADTGEALVRDPLVKMISFTGSTRTGRQVGSTAGGLLKRVSLELGGSNPYIVLDDANIETAASAGAFGSFFHQGQICMNVGCHIVQESIVSSYTDNLVRRAEKLRVGDPSRDEVHLGPIINERQAANVERIVQESVAQGARILTGGKRRGLFFEPTVLDRVRPGMPVFDEEIFGPVAPIVSFRTDEEAINLGNGTEYGLSAAVVSPNLARAQRIADRLHAGMVHINDQTLIHEVYGPIGGIGASGNGYKYSSVTNADLFTEWQWLSIQSEVPHYPF